MTEAEERAEEVESAYQELKQQHVGATQDAGYGQMTLREALKATLASARTDRRVLTGKL